MSEGERPALSISASSIQASVKRIERVRGDWFRGAGAKLQAGRAKNSARRECGFLGRLTAPVLSRDPWWTTSNKLIRIERLYLGIYRPSRVHGNGSKPARGSPKDKHTLGAPSFSP
jgi:hypothetical protein